MNIGFAQIRGYTLSAPHPPLPSAPYHRYLPGGLTMFLVRKTKNQLMFGFVTFF